ncbi:MAG: AraC family transcriptional regulator [Proteobacteria bacterium]|nr:AraC family transcriptional regulator [Pseudomonadota bacterium]
MAFPQKTVSSMGMRLFFKILLANGLSLRKIEQSTGIIREKLDNPRYKVPMSRFIKLAEIGFHVTQNPALGLHLGKCADRSLLGILTALAMNCDTLLEACEYWSHYIKLSAEANEIEIGEEGENHVITYTNTSHYQPAWIPEFLLNTVVALCRKSGHRDINPIEVQFQHPAPSYIDEYQKVFKAPVLFEQKENALVISKYDLRRSIPHANPILKNMLVEQADALLGEQSQTRRYEDRVRVFILKNISNQKLDICAAASTLRMHRTTLYRKLSLEGTSFTAVLEEVRQKLALTYIKQDLSNCHIADRLGYSEPSAFQNAFKRWFGKSPGEYRLYSD